MQYCFCKGNGSGPIFVHVLAGGVNQDHVMDEWMAYYTRVLRAASVHFVHNRGKLHEGSKAPSGRFIWLENGHCP